MNLDLKRLSLADVGLKIFIEMEIDLKAQFLELLELRQRVRQAERGLESPRQVLSLQLLSVCEGEEVSKPFPNVRQRDILQKLMEAEWTHHKRLAPAGEGVLGSLISKGWIERRAADEGAVSYRITEQGKQTFRMPMPLR